nr:hypothetical protein [Tanacetum cinerariifolium]
VVPVLEVVQVVAEEAAVLVEVVALVALDFTVEEVVIRFLVRLEGDLGRLTLILVVELYREFGRQKGDGTEDAGYARTDSSLSPRTMEKIPRLADQLTKGVPAVGIQTISKSISRSMM